MDQLQRATEQINSGVAGNTGFGANIKFAFDNLGSVYIRGDGAAITVNNDEGEADLEVRMPIEYFQAIMDGRVNAGRLMNSGLVRFKGDVKLVTTAYQLVESEFGGPGGIKKS